MSEFRQGDMVQTQDGREGWFVELRTAQEQEEAYDRSTGPLTEAEDGRETPEFEDEVTVLFEDGKTEKFHPYNLEIVTAKIYVNTYLHDRAYGGAEEGGWYYDTWEPTESLRCRDEAHAKAVYERKLAEATEENRHRRSDISSVLSEGRYEVRMEAWPAEPYPAVTPHYE